MPVSVANQSGLMPEWLKPENASVMDPVYRAPLRNLVQLLGLDDPNQIMGTATPLMTLAPRVPAAELVEKLAPLDKVSMDVRAAVQHLVDRFPRLMSHVSRINPSPLATEERTTMGRMVPEIIAKLPQLAADLPEGQAMRGPVAMLQYDPQAVKGRELETLAHEATHVAQTVRATDVSRRIPGQPTFPDLYERMTAAQGYYNNPFEVAARETAKSVVDKKATIFGPQAVAAKLMDSFGGDIVKVWDRLKVIYPDADNVTLMSALKAARTK